MRPIPAYKTETIEGASKLNQERITINHQMRPATADVALKDNDNFEN